MKSIYHLSKAELETALDPRAPETYRTDQIWNGIYRQYYRDWDDFSNLPGDLINFLSKRFSIFSLKKIAANSSIDQKTNKVVFKLHDENLIETVHIANDGRNTICISTQAGCPVGCIFCATGFSGFQRNLTFDEIVGQITYFSRELLQVDQQITNIVLMGMGEPFLNYENTLKAVFSFNNPDKFNIGARRITVSTIGIPDKIKRFAEIGKQFNLAISLHAPNDHLRRQLVPLSSNTSVKNILSAAQYYIDNTNRRVTYEYVLINRVNDHTDHARELARLINRQNCHINLIALNQNDHFKGKPSGEDKIKAFSKILLDHGIPTTIRNSQGASIQAGCGQLSGLYKRNLES